MAGITEIAQLGAAIGCEIRNLLVAYGSIQVPLGGGAYLAIRIQSLIALKAIYGGFGRWAETTIGIGLQIAEVV